jgi:hypothetical protein
MSGKVRCWDVVMLRWRSNVSELVGHYIFVHTRGIEWKWLCWLGGDLSRTRKRISTQGKRRNISRLRDPRSKSIFLVAVCYSKFIRIRSSTPHVVMGFAAVAPWIREHRTLYLLKRQFGRK